MRMQVIDPRIVIALIACSDITIVQALGLNSSNLNHAMLVLR
jgi:hypothetical protein